MGGRSVPRVAGAIAGGGNRVHREAGASHDLRLAINQKFIGRISLRASAGMAPTLSSSHFMLPGASRSLSGNRATAMWNFRVAPGGKAFEERRPLATTC